MLTDRRLELKGSGDMLGTLGTGEQEILWIKIRQVS
jgi:hypothetical protein